jgi:hypothetical protein
VELAAGRGDGGGDDCGGGLMYYLQASPPWAWRSSTDLVLGLSNTGSGDENDDDDDDDDVNTALVFE